MAFPVAWFAPLLRAGLLPLFGLSEISVISGLQSLWESDPVLALLVTFCAIFAPILKVLGRALRDRLGGQNIAQEQCAGPRFDLFVDLRGDERDSRQLLVAKHVLHVFTQHATGEIR